MIVVARVLRHATAVLPGVPQPLSAGRNPRLLAARPRHAASRGWPLPLSANPFSPRVVRSALVKAIPSCTGRRSPISKGAAFCSVVPASGLLADWATACGRRRGTFSSTRWRESRTPSPVPVLTAFASPWSRRPATGRDEPLCFRWRRDHFLYSRPAALVWPRRLNVKPGPTYWHDVQVASGVVAMLLVIVLAVCASCFEDAIPPDHNALVTGRHPSLSPASPGGPARPPE